MRWPRRTAVVGQAVPGTAGGPRDDGGGCGVAQQQLALAGSSSSYPVQQLELADGRRLAYACLGAPLETAQMVCIYHHGVPASLVESEPLAAAGAPLGVAVVAFDRSGMGGSGPNPGMSFRSVVDDAAQLMDFLGLPQAVQVGESGGAPYAAAFAALHPERTQQLLLLAGLGPTHGREHAHLRRGLNAMDRISMHASRLLAPGLPGAINRAVKLAAYRAPGAVKRGAGGSLGPADARYLQGNDAAKDWLLRFMQRAYQQGVRGVLQDYRVLGSDWGVDIRCIQARTALWHGAADQVVASSHAEWYCAAIPGAQLRLVEGEGHVSLVGRHAGEIWEDAVAHHATASAASRDGNADPPLSSV